MLLVSSVSLPIFLGRRSDVPFTIGQALDLLPTVLFLHVFLAYPSGRLRTRFERALVVTAYATAIGFQVVRMSLGGFGPHNLFESLQPRGRPRRCCIFNSSQSARSAFVEWASSLPAALVTGRPLRRSLALLIDAFALGLVMIAFLLPSYAFDGPGSQRSGGPPS